MNISMHHLEMPTATSLVLDVARFDRQTDRSSGDPDGLDTRQSAGYNRLALIENDFQLGRPDEPRSRYAQDTTQRARL